MSYTGLPASPDYKSLTVYYPPSGTGPYVVIAIMPGFTTPSSLLAPWAEFVASHGYVGVTVEPLNTNVDQPSVRAAALWAAIGTLKAENTRATSPLIGKISDCFGVMGHSMGGGGSLHAANLHPTDIKAAIPLNPWQTGGSFPKIVAPTLILAGQTDTTAPPAQHGKVHYDSIPATTIKQYVEATGGSHQSAFSPNGLNARYAISWLKYNVDGDVRYRPFLDKAATGLSTFETTLK
jgi:pimeloyl-ACP methyl ester carboxylesterase